MSNQPASSQSEASSQSVPSSSDGESSVIAATAPGEFDSWHALNEKDRNREEGYSDTRNDPSHTPDPEDHSPSGLLRCDRMAYYAANNAPREERLPHGIFKFGHDFEAYYEEFLREEVASDGQTVRNVERVDFEVEGLHFGGTTDPVIFDSTGEPEALFEVKTTEDTHYVEENGVEAEYEQHLAQAHAYAYGLMEKYGLDSPPQIIFVYASRNDLTVYREEVEFSEEFWEETVLEWALENTEWREGDELPPALDDDDDMAYMCGYCDYKERCGNYEPDSKSPNADAYVKSVDSYWWKDEIATEFQNTASDTGVEGFLPLTVYPEAAVVSHLATYDDVELTPTLAAEYPFLVAGNDEPVPDRVAKLYGVTPERGVVDWICPDCKNAFDYERFNEWDGSFENRPQCPHCPDDVDAELRGMKPGENPLGIDL